MTTYLLDANVLIAVTIAEHEHHDRCLTWVATVERLALCPIVEGALIRYLLRIGERVAVAHALLAAVRALPTVEFWPELLSYVDVRLDHVRGHRQVTDAYLAELARSHPGGRLATLDEDLAADLPTATLLVPSVGHGAG